jgi:hypothetical protein
MEDAVFNIWSEKTAGKKLGWEGGYKEQSLDRG